MKKLSKFPTAICVFSLVEVLQKKELTALNVKSTYFYEKHLWIESFFFGQKTENNRPAFFHGNVLTLNYIEKCLFAFIFGQKTTSR
jgi:hypothetical protein